MLLLTLTLEQEEYRSSGVQAFRSSGGKKNSGERCGSFAPTLDELNLGATSQASKGHNPPLEKNFSGSHSDVGLESLSHSSF